MDAKYTPGPWRLLPIGGGKYYGTKVEIGGALVTIWGTGKRIYKASEREIACGWEPEDGMDHVEDETDYANARLIAAAPELLAALRAMLTHMGMDEDEWNRPTFAQARAAIAKAEGM